MILLEKYIKAFLKEAASSAISKRASDLTGKIQHQSAASYDNDMSEIDNQEALLKVLENVGNNCFISFVNKYDEKIPRLEISPEVSYDTPHGNYAYPLTVESLKDIVEKGRVGGANFALDRSYFHIFKKSNLLNFVEIEKDGSNNYSGDFRKDFMTIAHTAVVFKTAKVLEDKEFDKNNYRISKYNTEDLVENIKSIVLANINLWDEDDASFRNTFNKLSKILSELVKANDNKFPHKVTSHVVSFIARQLYKKSQTDANRFFDFKSSKSKSDFHTLFYACWTLSNIIADSNTYENDDPNAFNVDAINNWKHNSLRQGALFTMLLNAIDIDFINDRGSKTLHSSEPIQAVYLNSSKKENVILIGTFNNIFKNNINISPSTSNKSVTMNKIVNIIEQNPQLNDLFGTELFDDVKLEHPLSGLREKAWTDLTENKSYDFFDFILFHSSNKIFNLNMYVGKNKEIVFDIGIKEKFLDASIKKQLKIIKREMPKIAKIQDNLAYIQVFLSKHRNESIYTIKDKSSYDNTIKTLNKIQDHAANLEWNSLTDDEEKTSFIMVKVFMNICEEISQLAGIASYQ